MGKTTTRKREKGRPVVDDMNQAAFRKLAPADQIAQIRGDYVERTFKVERDGIDEEARTVWLSIASERPYERWWGIEILDHNAKSIRDERLGAGAALLVGHDPDDQVGVVEKFEITAQKKLRVLARFGRSARAEEIWNDVLDGIRRNTSVGYIIHDLVLEKSEEGVNTYRVTDWEPLEGSLVSIPADPGVGVGRQHEPQPVKRTETMDPKEQEKIEAEARARVEAEQKAKIEHEKAIEAAVQREQSRVNAILAAGQEFADLGGVELARELIKDKDATESTFKARMADKMRGSTKPTATAQPGGQERPFYGEEARMRFRYGKLKAFTRNHTLSNGQTMPAEEAAYRSGMWMAAMLFQKDWAQKWCKDNGIDFYTQNDATGAVSRVMSSATLSAGGALVPVEMEQAIIDLRDTYGVTRRLVRVRPMNSDTKTIPRRTGGVTAYFFTDTDGTGINASDKSWDDVNLVAKKLGALTRVSEDLEEDAVIDVVDDIANEIAYAFAVKEDNCWLNGDGTSTYGGMEGLLVKLNGTAYSSRIALASGNDTFAEVTATDLANVMAGVAAYGKPMAKWLTSETGKALMFDRLMAAAGGNTTQTLTGAIAPSYLGYEIVTSEAMPAGAATDYSDAAMFCFGRYDLSSSMGNRRGITLQVLRERYAELGQIGIKGTERFDIVNHDLGSTSAKGPVALGRGN